jgi:hypothetical protein
VTEETQFSPVHVDPQRLPEEWVDYPESYRRYSEQAADAWTALLHAKKHLDRTAAQLRLKMRLSPVTFGLKDKPTVDSVKDCCETHPDYQAAYDAWIAAHDANNRLKGRLEAMHAKKAALENLTKLTLAGLFAQPRVAGVPQDVIDDFRQRHQADDSLPFEAEVADGGEDQL